MIREATLDDIPALIDMGMRFYAGSAYSRMLGVPDKSQVAATLRNLTGLPSGIVLVAEKDGQLVGAILGLIVPHFVTAQLVATELSWWVDPEVRGATGIHLLKRLEEWASEFGAVCLTMAEPPENPGVGRLYERLGYRLSEKTYMKAF